jgi:aspartyl-tRNA(Asn)/glutamyl-tRNA(Gln) amidotransferase subunit A
MAPALAEQRMYRVAAAYETARDAAQGGPLINRVPQLEVAR